jgi:hypothetical protein
MKALRVELVLPLPIACDRAILLLALRDPEAADRDFALPDFDLLFPLLECLVDFPFAISSSNTWLDAQAVEKLHAISLNSQDHCYDAPRNHLTVVVQIDPPPRRSH